MQSLTASRHVDRSAHRRPSKILSRPGRFRGHTWQIDDRERWALIGRNGAGKSTLIKMLLGQEEADLGTIWQRPGSRIGDATFGKMIHSLTVKPATRFLERVGQAPNWRCAEVAAKLGLGPEILTQAAHSLPGGLRQAQLAGLLVPEPDFIICDEPTNFLDLRTQIYLERLLGELSKSGY